ncbi:MAG: tetratricopeptide repeat protein [Bacteroidota bacterium]
MIKKIIFFFLGISSFLFLSGQKLKTLLKDGDRSMEVKDYNAASQYYGRALLLDSTKLDLIWKYAESCRLNYDFDEARHWYEKVNKADGMKTYPEAPFWIGNILQYKAQYKEARKYYDKFSKKFIKSKDEHLKNLANKAKMQSVACEFALIQLKSPLDVFIEHLDTSVNSKLSEYAPYEYDTTLYFSSLRNLSDKDTDFGINFNKLYVARKKKGVLQVTKEKESKIFKHSEELDSIFNKNGVHNANTCFNKDFTELYVSRCKQIDNATFNCKIYRSVLREGKWTDPKELPSPINIGGINTTQPNVGEIDGKPYLFFSSNRGGGEGGLDIWFSSINEDGSFGNPVNAGKKINSPEDEITPFFVNHLKTLYFSSTWHKGMGGYDIFKSEFKNGLFSDVVNAGYPINTSQNDIYFSLNSKKDKAYISSNRPGSYYEEKPGCCNDIYAFSVPPPTDTTSIKISIDTSKIVIEKLKILCPLTLYFHNDEPNPRTHDTVTKKTYKKTYDEYVALRPTYLKYYPQGRKGEEKERAETRINAFMEDSVDAGMHDLEQFSLLLEQAVKQNEKIKITMKGFCSPLASTQYNIYLAKRRVSSLRNYFMEYKNGLFVKYVNNKNANEARIEFFEEDVGELTSSKVSDSAKDQQNSVYSPGAARERKIQIIAVSTIK